MCSLYRPNRHLRLGLRGGLLGGAEGGASRERSVGIPVGYLSWMASLETRSVLDNQGPDLEVHVFVYTKLVMRFWFLAWLTNILTPN